ncbi:hypothetical protein [Polymorphospora sp. NPDC050346]|uniref:hypothetical protein n=1 Tax=Polymorphospora sp. NPDC050346 TaxID=3155780 RepID=UPI0033CCF10B
MPVDTQRSMSAPPEVVFNTATDPDRMGAWLPEPLLKADHRMATDQPMQARWDTAGDDGPGTSPASGGRNWSAFLRVEDVPAGGALVRLRLDADADTPPDRLTGIAEEALTCLAREVADNLTAG